MCAIALNFPDQIYSSSTRPNTTTLKGDLSAIETDHNAHLASTTEHGATGAVVGESNTQTLTNKTLTSPTITSPTLSGAVDGWVGVTGSCAFASADSPTFTITVPSGAASIYFAGMRIKLTQTTVKYFIITAVTDTVLTVYGGTDYTLANAAISAMYYSTQKAPLGFPMAPEKWSIIVTDSGNRTVASPTGAAWYNVSELNTSVPIGIWDIKARCSLYAVGSGLNAQFCLSTANNSCSNTLLLAHYYVSVSATYVFSNFIFGRITLSSKTPYYLNISANTATEIGARGDIVPTLVTYTCAYL